MLAAVLIVLSAACSVSKETSETGIPEETQQAETNKEKRGTIEMTLKINDEVVNVSWEDNESVRALADLAAKGPVVIDTSIYGGFEQVGALGTTLNGEVRRYGRTPRKSF
jgi:hypothetical protein